MRQFRIYVIDPDSYFYSALNLALLILLKKIDFTIKNITFEMV